MTIIGSNAELERKLILERTKAGMKRVRFEGQRLSRPSLAID